MTKSEDSGAVKPPPHTLTVTKIPDDESDDFDYTITCYGLTPACTLWLPCTECEKHPWSQDIFDSILKTEPTVIHGVIHDVIDSHIMVRTDKCWVVTEPDWTDYSAYNDFGDRLGTFPVDFDYMGDREAYLYLMDLTPAILAKYPLEVQNAILLTAALG